MSGRDLKALFSEEHLEQLVETTSGRVRDVYLDHAATTLPFVAVQETVADFLRTYGSVHRGSGQRSLQSTASYERARDRIYDFVHASSDEYVIFTKNTTEAINHAAQLWSKISGTVLVSDIEHSSNLLPWLTTNDVVQYRTNSDGTVNLAALHEIFSQNHDIKLLTVTGSSNVTGYRPPIHALAKLAHTHGAQIFVDACQLIQHHPLDVRPNGDLEHLDFIAFSGHKMYAPFGSGVLVGPKRFFDDSFPYQIGGGNLTYISHHLELKRPLTVQAHDPGTPNAVGAVAIATALDVFESLGYDAIEQYESSLVLDAFDQLQQINGVRMYVSREHLGSVLSFDLEGISAYQVAEKLREEHGISVRAGSFCTYELLRKLKGISHEEDTRIAHDIDQGDLSQIPTLVRASFGLMNRPEDVHRLISAVYQIASEVQK